MGIRTPIILCCLLTAGSACAATSHWGANDDPVVVELVAAEARWATLQCGPNPEMAAYVADDFQGTGTNGARYGRAAAIQQGVEFHPKLSHVSG